MEVLEDTICVRCAMEACMATSFDARGVARGGPRRPDGSVCAFVCYFTHASDDANRESRSRLDSITPARRRRRL